YRERTPRSAALFERAQRYLPGGDSRSTLHFSPYPAYMARGTGCRLFDVDGNEYLDLLNNYTALVHGHAHPRIVAAIAEQAARGTAHGAPVELQVTLAEALCRRVRSIERIRFANSGTEAVLNAIRAARAFTGRPKILKMEGGYHGTYDAAAVSVDPGAASPAWPAGRPEGPGLSPGLMAEVLVAPFNDGERVGEIVERHHNELAAVIVEPVLGAAGMIPADDAFLKGLREVTRTSDVLLILDEVITFRLSGGGAQEVYAVRPDLTTFGKLIGGGIAVGAFGGRADVMDAFDPRRPDHIPQSGTFNANAATLAAGLAALDLLTADAIARINAQGERLRAELQSVLDDAGVRGHVTGAGSLAHVHLVDGRVTDYRSAAQGRRSTAWRWLHLALLNRGVMVAPRGMFIVSTPMADADIRGAVTQFREAITEVLPLLVETGVQAGA
ncbi:MAG: aspartate aminotransferase family protein, partial [Gemmatimonadetes bacterium]|nr:aspartate aminotransferase family protein [Gemmatimonadota bacterium]